jgi:hypothetical protein
MESPPVRAGRVQKLVVRRRRSGKTIFVVNGRIPYDLTAWVTERYGSGCVQTIMRREDPPPR